MTFLSHFGRHTKVKGLFWHMTGKPDSGLEPSIPDSVRHFFVRADFGLFDIQHTNLWLFCHILDDILKYDFFCHFDFGRHTKVWLFCHIFWMTYYDYDRFCHILDWHTTSMTFLSTFWRTYYSTTFLSTFWTTYLKHDFFVTFWSTY